MTSVSVTSVLSGALDALHSLHLSHRPSDAVLPSDTHVTLPVSELLTICAHALESSLDPESNPRVHLEALRWDEPHQGYLNTAYGDDTHPSASSSFASNAYSNSYVEGSGNAGVMSTSFDPQATKGDIDVLAPRLVPASTHTVGAKVLPPPPLGASMRAHTAGSGNGNTGRSIFGNKNRNGNSNNNNNSNTTRNTPRARTAPASGRVSVTARLKPGVASGGGHHASNASNSGVSNGTGRRYKYRKPREPVPPPDTRARRAREAAKQQLEAYRASRLAKSKAEGENDLRESLRILTDHKREAAILSARVAAERDAHYDAEVAKLESAWERERALFDADWAEREAEEEAIIEDRFERLRISHEAECAGLETAIEDKPKPKPKFSSKLLDLRRTQQLQAKAGLADLSLQTAAEADALEHEETTRHEAAVEAGEDRQRRVMAERHAREDRMMENRAVEARVKVQRSRKRALQMLEQKFAHHRKDLDHARIIESHKKAETTDPQGRSGMISARGSAPAASLRATALLGSK